MSIFSAICKKIPMNSVRVTYESIDNLSVVIETGKNLHEYFILKDKMKTSSRRTKTCIVHKSYDLQPGDECIVWTKNIAYDYYYLAITSENAALLALSKLKVQVDKGMFEPEPEAKLKEMIEQSFIAPQIEESLNLKEAIEMYSCIAHGKEWNRCLFG